MKKIVAISGASIIAIGLLIGALQILLGNSFMPTETLNGIKVSWIKFDKACSTVEEKLSDYTLELETLTGESIELKIPIKVSLNKDQISLDSVFWLKRLVQGAQYNLDTSITYEQADITKSIESSGLLEKSNTIKSEDAYISDFDTLSIEKEVQGNELDNEVLVQQVKQAISKLSPTLNILESGGYNTPKITESKIRENLASRGSNFNFTITYEFGGKQYKFNREYLESGDYIELNSDGTEKIKEEAISDFVSTMNSDLSTLGRGINFKTTARGTIYVPGGNWGWWMDTSKTATNLKDLISAGKDATGEISWRQTAPKYGAVEFDNYVEIDLTKQHLYLYKNNSLIGDWDIVSGLSSDPNRKTPAGIFKLTYKEKNAVLRGEGYESPVTYWMPFNGGIGMHDASWRSSFGGSIYTYNGSHGCINMPFNGAKTVYENIDSSYAIICYY